MGMSTRCLPRIFGVWAKGLISPLVSQSLYSLMQLAGHERKSNSVAEFKGGITNRGLFQIIKARSYLVIYQGE